MGQEEVKNILEKSKDWLLSREIANLAKISLGSVQSSLQRMIKWGEVETRKAREVIKDSSRITSNHPGIAYRLKEDMGKKRVLNKINTRSKPKDNKKFKKNGIIDAGNIQVMHAQVLSK